MWAFQSVARIEQQWGQWYALVTLTREEVPSSYYIQMGASEPSEQAASAAGAELARVKSLQDAYVASDSIAREDFLARFTNAEIARIYAAAGVNADVFAYVKKMELNPTINRTHPDVTGGLAMLAQADLLDHAGRADEILASPSVS